MAQHQADLTLSELQTHLSSLDWQNREVMNEVHDLLTHYRNIEDDWFNMCHLNEDEGHTSNEVASEPQRYAMHVVCWRPGRGSLIRRTHSRNEYVKVLRGSLIEERYTFNEHRARGSRLQRRTEVTLDVNHVSLRNYINDFHSLRNPSDSAVTVSLHVCRPMLERYTVIDRETEEMEDFMLANPHPQDAAVTGRASERQHLFASMVNREYAMLSIIVVPTINELVRFLDDLDWSEPSHVARAFFYLDKYSGTADDWRRYCYYRPSEGYSRNEITRNEGNYTLLLIYSRPFDGNLPHDHNGTLNHFKVLTGRVRETQYRTRRRETGLLELEIVKELNYDTKDVNEMENSLDFHCTRNPSTTDCVVTLSLYTSSEVTHRVFNREAGQPQVVIPPIVSRGGIPEMGNEGDLPAILFFD